MQAQLAQAEAKVAQARAELARAAAGRRDQRDDRPRGPPELAARPPRSSSGWPRCSRRRTPVTCRRMQAVDNMMTRENTPLERMRSLQPSSTARSAGRGRQGEVAAKRQAAAENLEITPALEKQARQRRPPRAPWSTTPSRRPPRDAAAARPSTADEREC